jgi:dUTP pyrophosphatase
LLKAKLLSKTATAPTVANAGEDLGYDLYASEDVTLRPGILTKVPTGVAAEFEVTIPVPSKIQGCVTAQRLPYGLLMRDRSSMAAKGIRLSAGVIDAGYRGELVALLTLESTQAPYEIKTGDKIAQMIPLPVLTGRGVTVVEALSESARGTSGFGSSGASKLSIAS